MRYYCSVCKETISERVYRFSMEKFGRALCIDHQKPFTPQSRISEKNLCTVCKESISNQVYDYSMKHYGSALCMNHQKTVTPQALKLSKALTSFDVEHKLEQYDGYKHVDIAIESAKLYLELDGSQHAFSTRQMLADDDRDKHSQKAGYTTKRIPNAWVDQNVDRLAANIAMLVNKRQNELREQGNRITITGIVKSVVKTARKLSEKLDDFE
ncbi:MAG TPA: DUF559 domain-containing protein [Acidobacteriota bacterium]|nr:DUF559 domain-containing protein [Acidobacteriota bacterium]